MASRGSVERSQGDFDLLISPRSNREIIPEIPTWEPPGRAALLRDQKATILIRDNNSAGGGVYTQNFLLQNYFRSSDEQMQLVLHSEGWNLIFFRSRPVVWSFSGVLYNEDPLVVTRGTPGPALNWTSSFIDLYETRLKGTVAAGRFTVSLIFAGRLVTGYIYKFDLSAKVPFDTVSTFNLQMIGSTDASGVSINQADSSVAPSAPANTTNQGTGTSKLNDPGTTTPPGAFQRTDSNLADPFTQVERVT